MFLPLVTLLVALFVLGIPLLLREYPVVLGEGEYFVLSDARNGGADSRCFGPVTQEEIQGIVITLLRRNNL